MDLRIPGLTSIAAAALLAACSRTPDSAATTRAAPVLGFSQVTTRGPWSAANTRSVEQAARESGVELRLADAAGSQQRQIAALREFIRERVDVIALTPVVETGWNTVLAEAREAGIPVLLTDRAIEVSDDSLYRCWIGPDFTDQGRRAARWLLQHTRDVPGEIDIVELRGTVGSTPADDRKQGFAEVIAIDPRYHIIRSQSAGFSRGPARLIMARFLREEGRRIRVLFAHNDDMALGAIEAIEEAGSKPGTDILVISIDGSREAFEAMIAGKLNVTVESSPLMGPWLM